MSAPTVITAAKRRTLFDSRYDSRHPLAHLRRHLDVLETRRSRLTAWAARHPCLRGADSIEQVIARAQGRPLHDDHAATTSPADDVLRALIAEHLRGDDDATAACLLAVYPLLRSLIDPDERDLANELVAETLRRLPEVAGQTGIAMRLKWLLRQRRRSLVVRTNPTDRATSRRCGEWIWEAQLGAASSDYLSPIGAEDNHHADQARQDAWGLLLDARAAGVITDTDAKILVHVHGLDPDHTDTSYAAAATRLQLTPEAARQRASRALRRLRGAVADGTLALA